MVVSKIPVKVDEFNDMIGSLVGVDMVHIHVGPDCKDFHIHKHLLCTKVPYFDKMFSGAFNEAAEGSANLPEEDADMFNLFTEWLYTDRLRSVDISKHRVDGGLIFARVKFYCFAHKLCLSGLMGYTVSVLIAVYQKKKKNNICPTVDAAQYAFEYTASGSPLREYMVHSMQYTLKLGTPNKWPIKPLYKAVVACPDLGMETLELIRKTETSAVLHPH